MGRLGGEGQQGEKRREKEGLPMRRDGSGRSCYGEGGFMDGLRGEQREKVDEKEEKEG